MTDEDRARLPRTRRALARSSAALRRFDSREALIALARAGRYRLPGDARYGDPLSLTGDETRSCWARAHRDRGRAPERAARARAGRPPGLAVGSRGAGPRARRP